MPPIRAFGSSSSITLAAGLVNAYVRNNSLPAAELPGLIARVHHAIADLSLRSVSSFNIPIIHGATCRPSAAEIRSSVKFDGIVSFIDGKTYKTLKRHLTGHGLYPQTYRERYGLPDDYPMVTEEYAARRSALAKHIGLGRAGKLDDAQRSEAA